MKGGVIRHYHACLCPSFYCCFYFILTSLLCVRVCLCPFPIAEHCRHSQSVRKDRNEPCCMVGRRFCWKGDPLPMQQITSPVGWCSQLTTVTHGPGDTKHQTPQAPSDHPTSLLHTFSILFVRKRWLLHASGESDVSALCVS